MAYQGGQRIRGYNKKMQHKSKINKRYRRLKFEGGYWFYYPDKPWKILTLSGCRGYCKRQTNRRLRAMPLGQGLVSPGEYRRVFDYWWTLF